MSKILDLYGSLAVPEKHFGGNGHLGAFYESVEAVAPMACVLKERLIDSWDAKAYEHEIVYPDGFHMIKKVTETVSLNINEDIIDASFEYRTEVNQPSEYGVSNAADGIHGTDALVVREMHRRCNYNEAKCIRALELIADELRKRDAPMFDKEHYYDADGSDFISLRAIDYIKRDNVGKYKTEFLQRLQYIVTTVIEHPKFELVTIHDAFKCLANYVNSMRRHYNFICAEIHRSELAMDMIEQLTGERPELVRNDYSRWILENNYAIN